MGAALILAMVGSACSSDGADTNRAAGGSGDEVTVAGCLAGGPDGRVVLTAAPEPGATAATRATTGGTQETYTYVLIGGSDLQSQIGRRVEVTGTLAGKTQEVEHEARRESESPVATSGRGETPTVTTKEEVEVQIRQLNVNTVRELAPTCQVNP